MHTCKYLLSRSQEAKHAGCSWLFIIDTGVSRPAFCGSHYTSSCATRSYPAPCAIFFLYAAHPSGGTSYRLT